MTYLFEPTVSSVAVVGSAYRYPVRRIYCVGRNYAEHVREMGKDPDRDRPLFFMKPADAVVESGEQVAYPSATRNLHHEIELVVAIGAAGAEISEKEAYGHVWGYGVGIDLTRRDLQLEAREKGRPWDTGKGFDQSAPISALHPTTEVGNPETGRIWLDVNGQTRQDANISHMIWNVPELVAHLSRLYRLEPGDLIYTGTPAGVGAVVRGDILTGGVDGVDTIRVEIR